MKKRTVSIIRRLSENPDEKFTIESLAELFSVSQRTVRNDLNAINDALSDNGLDALELLSRGRIKIGDNFGELLPLVSEGDFYDYKLSKEERIEVASILLVNSAGFITLSTIAETLFVSRATVIKDLDEIKELIGRSGLNVSSHPNKGLRVDGSESAKRLFLMELGGRTGSDAVNRQTGIQAGNRITIQKIISEQEHMHQSFLTDDSFRQILLYLGILVNRNLQGEYIEKRPHIETNKYLMAQDILKYVTQYCGIKTTEDEVQFLSEILADSKYMRQHSDQKEIIRVQLLTRQFIERVSDELEVNLNSDYEFFENLSNHLESVLTVKSPIYPENAIINEVLEEHPDVLEAVRNNIGVIRGFAGRELQEIEIGYIAIHICAALERRKNKEVAFHVIVSCSGGIGTSQLLMEKLKKHFNFQIVDVVASHEVKNMEPDRADLVISTVPLRGCRIEHVTVSPFLTDEDYIRVGNKIDALRDSRHLPSRIGEKDLTAKGLLEQLKPAIFDAVPEKAPDLYRQIRKLVRGYFNQSVEADAEIFAPSLHHLLSPEFIELDVECTDWRDAIRRSAQKLLDIGYIESRYVDAMIENVEENGPYIILADGFAMPHEGLEKGSVQVGMNLIRLKTPVRFDDEDYGPVRYVCCLSAVDHKTHLKAFFNLINLLRKSSLLEELDACTDPVEVSRVIERLEYSLDA